MLRPANLCHVTAGLRVGSALRVVPDEVAKLHHTKKGRPKAPFWELMRRPGLRPGAPRTVSAAA
jgi:hypothetical protein